MNKLHSLRTANSLWLSAALLIATAFVPATQAANLWWDNTATTANVWGQANNWATTATGGTDPAAAPLSGDTAIFNIDGLTTAQTVAMNGSRAASGLQFTNGTGGWTLQAHATAPTDEPLSIGAGGILVSSGVGPVALSNVSGRGNLTVSLTADQIWNLNNDLTCGAFLSGAFNLTKSGPNNLTLSANNSGYTGTIRATAGTLTINNASAITNATLDMNAADNGTVTLNSLASVGIGALTGSRNLSGVGSGTLTIGNKGSSTTYSGALSGSGALTKIGAGTLTLSGANNYSGTTTVSGGTLNIDVGVGGSLYGTSPYSALTLGGGTFLYDNTTATGAKSQNMGALTGNAGANTVQLNRTALQTTTLTLASVARATGGTINYVYGGTPGTIGLDSAINLTTQAAGYVGNGYYLNGADLVWMNAANTYIRAPVYGTDAGFVTGTTLTASSHNLLTANVSSIANNTAYSSIKINGASTISIGLAASSVIQCPAILCTGGSSLAINNNTGTCGIKAGSGGELIVRADTASDSVSLTAIDNSASKLTKTGAGTLTLRFTSTYTGVTTVNQGTLLVTGSTAAGSAVTVMNGATLGGSGTVNGTVTVNSGGIIQPSISGATNTLNLANAAAPTFNSGSILKVRVPTISTADKLNLNNAIPPTFTATGINLVIDTTGLSGNVSGATIVSAGAISGTFSSITVIGNTAFTATPHYNSTTITVDLTGPTAPSVTTQPSSTSTCAGSTATFSVSPTGQSYSWSKVGSGWGNSWSISGGGGVYRGTSTGNENGGGTCNSFASALDINSTSGNALGIYGGATPEIATRTFTALSAGQVVSIDLDNGGVDTGKKVGFSLQTSGGSDVLQFYFLGGQSNYKYNDGTERDTGIGFLRTGLRVQFVLNSATTYTLIVQSCGGTANYFTGTYSGTIAKLKLFNENTSTGAANDAFFNNFIVGGYTDNADNYSGAGSWAGSDVGEQPIASGNGGSSYTTPATVSGDSGSQYRVVVYNTGGTVVSSAATLTINAAPTITTASLAGGQVGAAYSQTVTATGGSTPYVFGVASGLPAGLSLSSAGAITGTPTTAGTNSFTVTVASATGCMGSSNLSVVISKGNQTITFGLGTTLTKTYGNAAFADAATASAGLAVTYSSDNVAVATVDSAGTVTIVGAGTVHILANQAGNGNYNAAPQASQTLTVNKASTFVGASSSNNPSGYRDSVAYTATLPADAAGSVVFTSPNGVFSTNTVISGSATSLSLTNLLRGTNLITLAYLGSGNYLGSTNTLNQIVTNHPPVALNATYYRAKGLSLKIPITSLLTNATDADGDTNALQGVGAGLTNATLLTDSTYVYYLPGTGAGSNDNDVVSYTVSDGFGGSATANLLITVYSAAGSAQLSLPTNGVVNITFFGIPNYTYVVQTTTNLSVPWWTLSTNTAGTNGTWQFTDPNATNAQQYYRSSQP